MFRLSCSYGILFTCDCNFCGSVIYGFEFQTANLNLSYWLVEGFFDS